MRTLRLLFCLAGAAGFMVQLPATAQSQRSAAAAISMGGAASKATRVNLRNREYNKKYKSEMRTRVKRVGEAVSEGEYSVASTLLSKAFAILDKNVKRGIIHKNTAARKKSQLHQKVKGLEPGAAAAEPAVAE